MIGGDEPIHRYDSTLAEAKEVLFRLLEIETDYIFYAKYFVSGDKGFGNKIKDDIYKMCMVIITDTLILVIYNSTKVVDLSRTVLVPLPLSVLFIPSHFIEDSILTPIL